MDNCPVASAKVYNLLQDNACYEMRNLQKDNCHDIPEEDPRYLYQERQEKTPDLPRMPEQAVKRRNPE